MESAGASSPGVLKLTTSLSMPFTRLDKYSNLLKEVERHTDSAHADRGDTQRAISVYREIAVRSVACYVTADVYDVSAVAPYCFGSCCLYMYIVCKRLWRWLKL